MNALVPLLLPIALIVAGVWSIGTAFRSARAAPRPDSGSPAGGAARDGDAEAGSSPLTVPGVSRTFKGAWAAEELWDLFFAQGIKWNVPPVLLSAIARTESNYYPRARGAAGEIGMMQIMPETAKTLLERRQYDPPDPELCKFPEVAVELGAMLLDELWLNLDLEGSRREPDDWELAVHGYNLGEPRVRRGQRNDVYVGRVYDAIRETDGWAGLSSVDRVVV